MILAGLRAAAWKYAALALAVLAVAAVVWCLFLRADAASADLRAATAEARAEGLAFELAEAKRVTKAEKAVADDNRGIEDRYDAERNAIEARASAAESESGRLRRLWGQCETDALAGSAAAAAETAGQDRLREASARRIERAVELAQSERNETIDRYEAVRKQFNAARSRD